MKNTIIAMKIILSILMVAIIASFVYADINQEEINNAIAERLKQAALKRVISERLTEKDLDDFLNRGCSIKHKLHNAYSFDCPGNALADLNVRESRIFHITGLASSRQIGADLV
jgi:hypothetical protein